MKPDRILKHWTLSLFEKLELIHFRIAVKEKERVLRENNVEMS